jgi:hypothetical protein
MAGRFLLSAGSRITLKSVDMRGRQDTAKWQADFSSPGLAKGNADVHNRRSFHP